MRRLGQTGVVASNRANFDAIDDLDQILIIADAEYDGDKPEQFVVEHKLARAPVSYYLR